jgi:hypothetical protein
MAYALSINGAQQTVDVDGDTPLLWRRPHAGTGTQAEFGALVKAWLESGAHCPEQ